MTIDVSPQDFQLRKTAYFKANTGVGRTKEEIIIKLINATSPMDLCHGAENCFSLFDVFDLSTIKLQNCLPHQVKVPKPYGLKYE